MWTAQGCVPTFECVENTGGAVCTTMISLHGNKVQLGQMQLDVHLRGSAVAVSSRPSGYAGYPGSCISSNCISPNTMKPTESKLQNSLE